MESMHRQTFKKKNYFSPNINFQMQFCKVLSSNPSLSIKKDYLVTGIILHMIMPLLEIPKLNLYSLEQILMEIKNSLLLLTVIGNKASKITK